MSEKKPDLLELFKIEKGDSSQKIAEKVRYLSKDKFDEETIKKLISKVIAENDKRILEEMVTGVSEDKPFTSKENIVFEDIDVDGDSNDLDDEVTKRYVGPKQVKRRKLNTKGIVIIVASIAAFVVLGVVLKSLLFGSSNKVNLSNKELQAIVSTYIEEKKLDSSKVDEITSITIINGEYKVNGDKITFKAQNSDFELKGLEELKGLKELTISETYTSVSLNFEVENTILSTLKIRKVELKTGIENIKHLKNLSLLQINNTNLSDITALESINLKSISLFGNNISKYRALKNITNINIWDDSDKFYTFTEISKLVASETVEKSENVKVLVPDLRVRTQPNTNGEVLGFAEEGVSYYIIDEYLDTTTNMKWFKISSDGWIATNQGQWTNYNE